MLYLVSTPIGNLEDITLRAIRILSSCDYILCEDTRKSKILLDHLKIRKRLMSFHRFSEKKHESKVIQDLENEKDIAIISDAGTPVISDPGSLIVKKCLEKKIKITAIPGPCSIIDAIVISGFENTPFQFIGFLPKKKSDLDRVLKKMIYYSGLSICFESQRRIIKTLNIIKELDKERNLAVARELTKKFEEVIRGTPKELIDHFSKTQPKGEMILLISKKEMEFRELDLEELLSILIEIHGLSLKDALKLASKLRKERKKTLYKKLKVIPSKFIIKQSENTGE